ncbi:undecaprenyl-diphosphatase [Saccharopolyspora antimicrobica]|uniref:Undecaprenyl-diphosphatase n=1 Tax=Saccharopolyspora antimicrobica TaxID=455193 RepID=A0A1I4Q8I1_9PSEU|nr:phosphatase PAP2 family protein [Saccharopolyspora antimicrobica]RKT84822.1 undecaprenyl-diphosphatase [Saccharopolyspora antimicrobica]SFM36401.1 undecaprenyl-diphosphatase [Saccharopolyspora antimicrobica]
MLIDLSADWYRAIVSWAAGTPLWVHHVVLFATQALLGVLAALTVLSWWRAGHRPQHLIPLLAGALGWVLAGLIKDVFQQPRPCNAMPIETIRACAEVSVWSLPSGHSTAAAALAVALALQWRRIALPVFAIAVLEGFTRIFIGVHYPHDVLAGFILGAVVAVVCTRLGWRARSRGTPAPGAQ